MSLSNIRVKIAHAGEWYDSLEFRPQLQEEIWICNGLGGEVYPARYVGAEAGCYHGLYGVTSDLRDDHYFWMHRPLGTPPTTRVFVKPVRTDGWIDSREQLPPLGAYLWIVKESSGLVRFAQSLQVPSPNGHPHFNKFTTGGQIISSYGHRLWRLAKAPDAPEV